jgi:hypothetical protein
LRSWLAAEPPSQLTEELPPFTLTGEERDRLSGHLSLGGNSLELRDRFGATRDLLEKAASGQHLAGDVIEKLRAAISGNGAEA